MGTFTTIKYLSLFISIIIVMFPILMIDSYVKLHAETDCKGLVVLTKLLIFSLFQANSVEANDALEFLEGLCLKSTKCICIGQLCVAC